MIIRTEEDKARVCIFINGLELSKPWDIGVKKYVKNRTLPQNKLYWKWNGILGQSIGNTANEIHVHLMDEFLPQKFVVVNGKESPIPKSTKVLNVKEFTEYLDHIYRHAASFHGLILPVPDELSYSR